MTASPAASRRSALLIALAVCCLLLAVNGGHLYTVDDETQFLGAEALVTRGALDVAPATDRNLNLVRGRQGLWYPYYPPGMALIGAPLVAVGQAAVAVTGLGSYYLPRTLFALQGVFWATVLAWLMVRAASAAGASPRQALILAVVHTFGTYAYMQARGPASSLPVAVAHTWIWIKIASGHRTTTDGLWAGLALGGAFLCRYDSAFVWPFWLLAGFAHARGVILGLLPGVVVALLANAYRFGGPLATGAPDAFSLFQGNILEGLWGLTLGANRGVLWYSPLSVLGFAGLWMMRSRLGLAAWIAMGATLWQLVIVSGLPHWAGGATWGPRYLATTLPLLSIGLLPFLAGARRWVRYVGISSAIALQCYGGIVSANAWGNLLWDYGVSDDHAWRTFQYNPWFGQWQVLRHATFQQLPDDWAQGERKLPAGDTPPNQTIRRSLDLWQIYSWKMGIPLAVSIALTGLLITIATSLGRRAFQSETKPSTI